MEATAFASPAEQAGHSRQFVTFVVGREVFAVPMGPVREIIRPPEVMGVPLAPRSLHGLANLRGRVLPIIGLRDIFGCEEKEQDDATRVLVIDYGTQVGFVVDRVSSVVTVEADQIEDVASIQSTVSNELLEGVIKGVGGHAMVMILGFKTLIEREFQELSRGAAGGAAAAARAAEGRAGAGEGAEDELQLVSFVVAGQEYAVPIEQVQEIVQVPEQIVRVPRSEAHVLGIMTLRNRLLPLVTLRRLFGLESAGLSEHNRIVVLSLGEQGAVGVVMDTVSEVLRVPRPLVEAMPALLARNQETRDLVAICRLDGGRRLVSILSAERMFAHQGVREALASAAEAGRGVAVMGRAEGEQTVDDDEQMVVFRLGQEEFGVPIEAVQEIVRIPDELTRVPRAPAFIEGVINLRGTVLPVVDQRRRFGLPHLERNDRQRIMVFTLDGTRTGFIVDSVSEVLKVPRPCIGPAPRLSAEQARIIHRVANLERQRRMILLLAVERLLAGEETDALAAALA